MSTATFPRVHNWGLDETITSAALNAEFNNVLNNLNPPGMGSYSDTVATMKLQTSPGGLGSESLATSLAGELERLRYMLAQITGNTLWYQLPSNSIAGLVAAIGTGLPANRIASGRTTGNSSMLCALIPAGNTASVTLSASSVTPFNYYVNGTAYSITASQAISLAVANSTPATAQSNVTDPVSALPDYGQTKGLGMYNTTYGVLTASAAFGTFVGQVCGFKLTATVSGTAEYGVAFIQSTSAMNNVWRGCMFDSSANRVVQQDIAHIALTPSVVTLLKTSWLFANTGLSLAVTYNNPVVSAVQPTSPATGDYWFDLTSTAWKTFNSTTWVQANATLIGLALQDTANCVAARTFESYVAVSGLHDIPLTQSSTAAIAAQNWFGRVSVFGSTSNFGPSKPSWTSANLDSGLVLSASTTYFLYLKENGTPLMSNQFPIYRRDLLGLYHPSETWRALGTVNTDSATAFSTTVKTFMGSSRPEMLVLDPTFYSTAGYSSNLGNTAQGTNVFQQRFIGSQFNGTCPISGAVIYADIATVSLTPGVWAFSGMAVTSQLANTPASTVINFGLGSSNGTATAGLTPGLSLMQTLFQGNSLVQLNATVVSTTGSIVSTALLTLPTGNLLGGQPVTSIVPKFLFQAGINNTVFYVKYGGSSSTVAGTLQFNGSYLFEKIDTPIGAPV